MTPNIIEAQNITKYYDNYCAIDQLNLSIPRGKILGLLGPNGAGKTSFIRIINQITMPDSGTILFDNEPLSSKHILQIGYMPEERGLYKNMKVGEQALYLAQLKGLSKKQAQEKLDFWFNRLNINSWWDKKLSELSKGMAQKVQFVTTVLHDPTLLIFDEPFSGFDPVNAEIIKNEILYLNEQGTSVIFSSHRMESVEELCDQIVLMNQSHKILEGNVREIKHQFKKNEFKIVFEKTDNQLFNSFQEQVEVLQKHQEGDEISLIVKAKPNFNLLAEAMKVGQISTFSEILPSMNEVFINAVTQHSNG